MIGAGKSLVEAVGTNRGLLWGVWWNVVLLGLSLVGWAVDRRSVLGLNPWIKPIKFELSIVVFLVTVAVLLQALPEAWQSIKAVLGWGFGVAMIVEITIIALQSARGVRSHMNFSTPLDTALFATMGIFILANTVFAAWLLLLWCRTDAGLPPAIVWGVRLGLVVLVAGSMEGVRIVANGGHTVGAPDGGAGLPFVNWSTAHGDLRVAHFFALHALQIFPLAGMALAATKLRVQVQLPALAAFVLAYCAAVAWMFVEALQGTPFVR